MPKPLSSANRLSWQATETTDYSGYSAIYSNP